MDAEKGDTMLARCECRERVRWAIGVDGGAAVALDLVRLATGGGVDVLVGA